MFNLHIVHPLIYYALTHFFLFCIYVGALTYVFKYGSCVFIIRTYMSGFIERMVTLKGLNMLIAYNSNIWKNIYCSRVSQFV